MKKYFRLVIFLFGSIGFREKVTAASEIFTGGSRKAFTTDFLTKKKKKNEGEVPQYYVTGNHPAIIDPKVFEQVQAEMERRNSQKGRVPRNTERDFRQNGTGSPEPAHL